MTAPLFLVPPGSLADAVPGGSWVLDGPEGRHAGTVQRLRAGELLDLADGDGIRLVCRATEVAPARLVLEVLEVRHEPAPEPSTTLVQALAKGGRDELAVATATELGVDAVVPWQAARSVSVWRGDKRTKGRERWVATVREAAKQARRSRVPEVAGVVGTKDLTDLVRAVVTRGGIALVLHEEASEPLTRVPLPTPCPDALVVVGPEGGIGEEEVAALVDAGARPVRLGPHVLRTSTAGPAALAVLLGRAGAWG